MALARPKIQHPAVAAYQPECRVNIEWAKNMARRAGAGPNPTKVGSLIDHFGNNFAGGWIDRRVAKMCHKFLPSTFMRTVPTPGGAEGSCSFEQLHEFRHCMWGGSPISFNFACSIAIRCSASALVKLGLKASGS